MGPPVERFDALNTFAATKWLAHTLAAATLEYCLNLPGDFSIENETR
jgi:hypothetical protein